ncbi:MAG TPA: cation diffusion facilitator family transporter [Ignavibacteria bacterium]|nr:cation diffusion facilitator family transporter [Ignavibacteria bacterium]
MNPDTTRIKKRAALISLIIGFLMFFGKMGAYLLTGSAAVLSDALESIVHIIATSFAFYSLIVSTKPPDKEHPYGHGKISFFSAGFEGAMIIIASFSIIYYAVRDIIFGSNISSLDIGAGIIIAASFINLILGWYLVKTGRKTKSIVLIADGKHVLTDSITSFGAVAALVLVLITDINLFDPIIAIILALNILWTGKDLVRESIGGLMNEQNKNIIEEIAGAVDKQRKLNPYWIDLHKLRYWKSGDRFIVDFHLTVPFFSSIEESHNEYDKLEHLLKEKLDTADLELLMHLDPCKLYFCKICRQGECKFRSEEQKFDAIWDDKKVIEDATFVVGDVAAADP